LLFALFLWRGLFLAFAFFCQFGSMKSNILAVIYLRYSLKLKHSGADMRLDNNENEYNNNNNNKICNCLPYTGSDRGAGEGDQLGNIKQLTPPRECFRLAGCKRGFYRKANGILEILSGLLRKKSLCG